MKKGVYISYTQIITTNCYLTFLVVLALPVPPVIISARMRLIVRSVVLALPVPPVIIPSSAGKKAHAVVLALPVPPVIIFNNFG